ncbi:hypothetical protein GWK47_016722 [Chionoecetes opilio]|uniref:Uncharacterized protein n=1 Tax=Chionoecetes opilio TaxID=41210 RepID=A0A8J5BYY0_CHIOP|nr:hypothetical protein GWK47_016722 [Chionoecetes opilio]
MVPSAFGIPEGLSCDGVTNLTSQESRGFLDTWRVGAEGLNQHITPSLTARERRQSSVPRGFPTRQHWPERLPGHRRPLHGGPHAVPQPPPQGSEASPAQLITGRQLRDAIPVDTSPL